jgi:hypothetical protein
MAAVWSVITIDSLVNLAIAESTSDFELTATAIERPKTVCKKFKIEQKTAELVAKTAILGIQMGLEQAATEIRESCDYLASVRNRIVHDKPFELIDLLEEGVELREFPWKWPKVEIDVYFEGLRNIFQKCDQVKEFAFAAAPKLKLRCVEYSFVHLYDKEQV